MFDNLILSDMFRPIKKPKIGLVVGDGVRSYDAGEIWYLFDVSTL